MIPTEDVLHRMQWDAEFGNRQFLIGYSDRVGKRIVKVPFQRIRFASGETQPPLK